MTQTILASAVLSPDRTYRYLLMRAWRPSKRTVMFVGLNPSTADERIDDPTVRRMIRFAREWGYGTMYLGNLFGLRAPSPQRLAGVHDPLGPQNDEWLMWMAAHSHIIVACWGAHPMADERARVVEPLLAARGEVFCLGTTKDGCPKHPLYLPLVTKPERMVVGYA